MRVDEFENFVDADEPLQRDLTDELDEETELDHALLEQLHVEMREP